MELDPQDVSFFTNRAAVHFEMGNYQECIKVRLRLRRGRGRGGTGRKKAPNSTRGGSGGLRGLCGPERLLTSLASLAGLRRRR